MAARPKLRARRLEVLAGGGDPDSINPTNLPPPVLDSPSLKTAPLARKQVGQIARTLGEDLLMMQALETEDGRRRFIWKYWGYWQLPHHAQMLNAAWEGGFWDVMCFTEGGKSTTFDVHFPILSLAHDPNRSHLLVGTNQRDARRWLRTVKNKLETCDELIKDYPWLARPKNGLWSANEFVIAGADVSRENPSYAAFGAGSGDVKGRRALAVLDDVEGPEIRNSPARREEVYQWMTMEAMRMMEDPAFVAQGYFLFLNTGTPFDPESVHIRLTTEHGFKSLRIPYKHQDGRLTWPKKRGKIIELWHRWPRETFIIAMCLDPTGGRDDLLTQERLVALAQRPQQRALSEKLPTFVCIDPAGGEGKRNDYAGISVSRYVWLPGGLRPHVQTLRAELSRYDPLRQVQSAAAWAREFNCPVIVEGNAMQKSTYRILFQRFYPDVKVDWQMTSEKKKWDPVMGLMMMKALMEEGHWTLMGDLKDEGNRTILQELRTLGQPNVHDHLVMSVWLGARWLYDRIKIQLQRRGHDTTRFPTALRFGEMPKANRVPRFSGFVR